MPTPRMRVERPARRRSSSPTDGVTALRAGKFTVVVVDAAGGHAVKTVTLNDPGDGQLAAARPGRAHRRPAAGCTPASRWPTRRKALHADGSVRARADAATLAQLRRGGGDASTGSATSPALKPGPVDHLRQAEGVSARSTYTVVRQPGGPPRPSRSRKRRVRTGDVVHLAATRHAGQRQRGARRADHLELHSTRRTTRSGGAGRRRDHRPGLFAGRTTRGATPCSPVRDRVSARTVVEVQPRRVRGARSR